VCNEVFVGQTLIDSRGPKSKELNI